MLLKLLYLYVLFLGSIGAQKNDGSSEVEGDRSSVPDKFDQPNYGFMLPEGFNENSTLLAVVDFITQKNHATPKIAVNFDELNWFDIGGVQKTKADNADVYSATVILKAGSDVKVDKTDQGIYKFVVEAQLGDNVLATTNVVVEVLALAPTTKRVRTTEDPIEISNVELVAAENDDDLVLGVGAEVSTTFSVEVSTVVATTPSETTAEVLTTTSESTTSTEVPTTTSEASEESTTSETSSESTIDLAGTPESKESTETSSESTVAVEVTTTSETSSESKSTSELAETSEESTSTSEPAESKELIETSSEPTVAVEVATTSETTTEPAETSEESTTPEATESKGSDHLESTVDVEVATTPEASSESTPEPAETSEESTTPEATESKGSESKSDHLESTVAEVTTTSETSTEPAETSEESTTPETSSESTSEQSETSEESTSPEATEISDHPEVTTTPTPLETDPELLTNIPEEASGTQETPSEDSLEASATQPSVEPTTIESSGELLTDESPIESPITILPLLNHIDSVDLEIEVLGNRKILDSRAGSQIRGLVIIPKSATRTTVAFSIEPEGLEIRPKVLRTGEIAGIFVNEKFNASRRSYEIVGKLENGAIVKEPLNLEVAQKSRSSDKIFELKEYEFSVLESAENGRTIGRIDENDMKIIGDSAKRFSLVGNSIILTCSEFDNENCLQNSAPRKMYSLMLLPNNGTLAPVQVTIKVQEKPGDLRTSDDVLRISDNRIIIPFVILTDVEPRISGTASRFLGLRKTSDMYQVQVINSAASGKYELEIQIQTDNQDKKKTIPVFVENSQSHAHFRKPKYSAKIDSSKITEGKRITQVELEGVPIDEAKIIILSGNPGWVTVEGYGGRVKVNSFDGEVYQGKYTLRIGAIDKKTLMILTETEVEIEVVNGKLKKNEEEVTAKLLETTFDRETFEENFKIPLESPDFILSEDSFAINEIGKREIYEPMNIKINKNTVEIRKVEGLRIISFNLINKNTKLIVLIRLVSTPAYLEKQEKLRAKPIYPEELMEVYMPEEMEKGRVVGVFPAVIPTSNLRTRSRIEGGMREAFNFNEETGELKIRKVIDYESLPNQQRSFDLKLISGEKGYESEGILRIHVVDIDDNPPLITREQINTVSLPEDLPGGAKIAEFDVTDPDGSRSFEVFLEGRGSEQYFANITNSGLLSIFLAQNAKLDREALDSNALIVRVEDMSGNSDRVIIPIQILDVNDNAPRFSRKMYEVEAVENWPKGVVLEKIQATDPDLGPSGNIHFSLEGSPPNLLSINETSGLLTVSGDLMGLSRAEPYAIRIIAQDSGSPPLNSSAVLNLRVRSKDELMSQPIVEFVNLKNRFDVEENIPDSQKIAKIEARVKGSREDGIFLEYTLKDLISDQESFQIDKTSGEIFATRPIDYEEAQDYTLLVTATNPADPTQTASTIIHLDIINLEDNSPEFPKSATRVFEVPTNTSKSTAIGRIVAYDADKKPIFYYIIPSCGSEMAANFTIDHEFGEIVYHPQKPTQEVSGRVEICILADSRENVDLVDVFYDSTAKNMQKITVEVRGKDLEEKEILVEAQKFSQVGDSLQNIEIPIDFNGQAQDFELETINFVPANYELGRDMISPEGSVALNKNTGELAATPRILDAPQGIYIAQLKNGRGIRELHHIRDDRKLKYVLAMERNEFGANMEKLKRQLREALKSMDVYFSEPLRDSKNSSYTSVCFYITKDNAILEDKQMSALLSNTNQYIDKIHHIFKVVNVDQCTQAKPLQISNDIPLNTFILISIVAVLILILVALIGYICCVARYRRSLEEKLKTPYYKSPGSQSYAPTTSSHTIGYY